MSKKVYFQQPSPVRYYACLSLCKNAFLLNDRQDHWENGQKLILSSILTILALFRH